MILFSTLVPTFVHAVLLTASPVSFLDPHGRMTREAWAERLSDPSFDSQRLEDQQAAIAVARWQMYQQRLVACVGGFVLVTTILAGLYYAAHAIGISPADAIAAIARHGVATAGGG